MADIIQTRRDLAANWTSANPILAQGEQGYETDTNNLKIGDGTTDWVNLPYINTTSVGQGTEGQTLRWESDTGEWQATSSLVVTDVGNVGIGTDSPAGLVEVSGTNTTVWEPELTGVYAYTPYPNELKLDNEAEGVTGSFASIFLNAGSGADKAQANTARIAAVKESVAFATSLAFSTRDTAGAMSERMRINASGNVGIGITSSANRRLDVSGDGNFAAGFNSTGTTQCGIALSDANTTSRTSTNIAAVGDDFIIDTVGIERMRITSTGAVGIGTTNPADAKLEVTAGTTAGDYTALMLRGGGAGILGDSVSLFMGTNAGSIARGCIITAENTAGSQQGHALTFSTSANASNPAERMRIDSTGNVGINQSNPTTKLHVEQNSGQTVARFGRSDGGTMRVELYGSNTTVNPSMGCVTNDLTFNTASTERMRIDATGAVGIGTVASSAKVRIWNATESYILYTENDTELVFGSRLDGRLRAPPTYLNIGTGRDLQIDGSGYFVAVSSSQQYKQDIEPYSKGMDTLMRLNPVSYRGHGTNDDSKVLAGFLAEDIDALGLSEFANYKDGAPDSVRYGELVTLAVKAIQEQQAQIDELRAQIEGLS